MSDPSARGRTSEIQMIAAAAVEQQSRVCAVIMEGIKKDIAELTAKVDRLMPLVTDVAVLKTRWQLFGIVGTVFGVIGTVVGILVAVLK